MIWYYLLMSCCQCPGLTSQYQYQSDPPYHTQCLLEAHPPGKGANISNPTWRRCSQYEVLSRNSIKNEAASTQLSHHGVTQVVSYVFWHIDQPPLSGGDQDKTMQGLKKGLVWQRAVRSLPSWESWRMGGMSSGLGTLHSYPQAFPPTIFNIFPEVPPTYFHFYLTIKPPEFRLEVLRYKIN